MPAATPISLEQPFEIRRSPIQGNGAFVTRSIKKGDRIVEYTGEVISVEESDRRYDDETMQRHHTFLFSLDNGYVIDGAVGGNDSRFINHSCAPNCEAIDVRGRIWVEALRDIEPGEELAYDYAYEREGFEDEKWEKLYLCKCGAPTCRGTILAPPVKPKRKKSAAKQKKRARRVKRSAIDHPNSAARHATDKRAAAKKKVAKKSAAKKVTKKSAAKKVTKKSAAKKGAKRGAKTRTKSTPRTKAAVKTRTKTTSRPKRAVKTRPTSSSKKGAKTRGRRRA